MLQTSTIKSYVRLCQPGTIMIMALIAFTTMQLAVPLGRAEPWSFIMVGVGVTILLVAAWGVFDQMLCAQQDVRMERTRLKPLPSGRVAYRHAREFALILLTLGVVTVSVVHAGLAVYGLIAVLTALLLSQLKTRHAMFRALIASVVCAIVPLFAFALMTHHLDISGFALALIVFLWVPIHYWSEAICRHEEYAHAQLLESTYPLIHDKSMARLVVMLYVTLLVLVSYLPFIIDMAGLLYLLAVSYLNVRCLFYAVQLYRSKDALYALLLHRYSKFYLAMTFGLLLIDHYFPILT